MIESVMQKRTDIRLSKVDQSVLLRAFIQGEAYYYQAPTTSLVERSSFVVSFHKASTILEYLRLFGRINVLARFSDTTFQGELVLGMNTDVILMINGEIDHEINSDPRILPMT